MSLSHGLWVSEPSLFHTAQGRGAPLPMDCSTGVGVTFPVAAFNHDYFQPFNAIVIISQTREIWQEMLKSESAGSDSAQAMRNDSEVHYGYLSQHHFHTALLNHSHGHCQLQGLSSGLSWEEHFLLLKVWVLLTLSIVDPMWLNAAAFDIAVSSTLVLRQASGPLGLSVLFKVITLISVLVPVPFPLFFTPSYRPVWTLCFSHSCSLLLVNF